ncbi:MAG: MerR family transcriptional regulator [Oceanospirillaceae bacterium]
MSQEDKQLFPIRELSELTQVNTVTIRAWERRYGLLKPARTAKGHRLYSLDDVNLVKVILDYMAKGVPVSKVKALLSQDEGALPSHSDNDWYLLMQQLEAVLASYSFSKTQRFLRDLFLTYPVSLCRKEIIEPVINKLEHNNSCLAEAALLQSAIIDYSLLRINAKTAKKQLYKIVLICAQRSPIWKLALSAIELTDASYTVTFINQPCSLDTWVAIAGKYPESNCVVFQEGVWKEHESKQIVQILEQHKHLLFCGTAAMLADIETIKRISSPEKILEHLTMHKV